MSLELFLFSNTLGNEVADAITRRRANSYKTINILPCFSGQVKVIIHKSVIIRKFVKPGTSPLTHLRLNASIILVFPASTFTPDRLIDSSREDPL